MQIQFLIKIENYMLFTKNTRLLLSRKPKTAYFASHTKYTNASEGKTKIMLR